jgi:hypothetical protein
LRLRALRAAFTDLLRTCLSPSIESSSEPLKLLHPCSPSPDSTASVTKRSDYPEKHEIYIQTASKVWAGAFAGLSGALIAGAAAGDDRGALLNVLKQHNVDPAKILGDEFEAVCRQSGVVPIKAAPADAQFEFDVKNLGLTVRSGFATQLSPYLGVEAKLTRRDGTILWKRNYFKQETDVRHDADDYAQNPAVLRSAFQQASRSIARDMVRDLQDDSRR